MTRSILYICCAALILFACLAVIMTLHGAVTVIVTEDGFIPQETVIPKGATVTFLNESDRTVWPASNPHPVHTDYSGDGCGALTFDACGGVNEDASWDFTFAKEGTWKYHDHLAPDWQGEVVVLPPFMFLYTAFISFFTEVQENAVISESPTPETFRYAESEVQWNTIEKMSKESPDATWTFLKAAAFEDGVQIPHTIPSHELGHVIGREMYTHFGIDGIAHCSEEFSFACFHAAVSEALIVRGFEHASEIARVCTESRPSDLAFRGNCMHGMGHGFATLEELDLTAALADCDSILRGEDDRYHCYSGAFMEFFHSAPLKLLEEEDPWRICTERDGRYHSACAYRMPDQFERLYAYTGTEALNACMSAPTETLRFSCIRKAARIVSTESLGDSSAVEEACGGTNEYRDICLLSAALENTRAMWKDSVANADRICKAIEEHIVEEDCLSRNNGGKQSYSAE